MTAGKMIRGRIVDAAGRPMPDWQVTADDYSQGPDRLTDMSDSAGRFVLRNAEANRYRLRLRPRGNARFHEIQRDGVTPGDEIEIRLDETSLPTATLRGTILGPDNAIVDELSAYLNRNNRGHPVDVDADSGNFRIGPVPAGAYMLNIRVRKRRMKALGPIELSPHQNLDLGVVRLDPSIPVSFRVWRTDNPRSPIFVSIMTAGGHHLFNLRAEGEQSPSIAMVPGRYVAKIDNTIAPFEVRRGGPTQIALRPNVGITHRLALRSEAPASGYVIVEVYAADDTLFCVGGGISSATAPRSRVHGEVAQQPAVRRFLPSTEWQADVQLPAGACRIAVRTQEGLHGELHLDSPPTSDAPLEIVLR